MAVISAAPPTSRAERKKQLKSSHFRPEIEGLRAVAVFLVVIYHIWLGRVSGGVDIFLLISAFLMTTQLVRVFDSGKTFNVLKRYVHTFKRLLPAASVVLIAVLIAAFIFVPPARWQSIISETWASLFYYENWQLALNSVNYYSADHGQASPLQHFWSLSIQGQIFTIWPLIFAAIFVLARKRRAWFRPALFIVFGVIFIASLAFSIYETRTNQEFAYFDGFTRVWEFALGTLLALVLPYLRLPRLLRIALGWIGIAGVISCGLILDVAGQFPGFLALWPLLSAAFIITAGQTGSAWGVDRILSSPLWGFMGKSSYALYLWHWPILVIFLTKFNLEQVSFKHGCMLIAASIVLAILTTYLVDQPIRKAKGIDKSVLKSLGVIVVCVALVSVAAGTAQAVVSYRIAKASAQSIADNPGARVLTGEFTGPVNPDALVRPAPEDLPKQFASLADSTCTGNFVPQTKDLKDRCSQDAPYGPNAPTIAFLGDSHIEQWMPAFKPLQESLGANAVSVLMGGCPFGVPNKGTGAQCNDYNAQVLQYVKKLHPTYVITVATAAKPSSADETMVAGWDEAVKTLSDQGATVIGMRDNPRYNFNIAECATSKGDDCSRPVTDQLAPTPPYQSALDKGQYPSTVHFIDATDLFCPDGKCEPIIGNMMVYLDDNHITKDYAASMAKEISSRALKALGR